MEMNTINEQLNIPIVRAGETIYQPAQYETGIDTDEIGYDAPIVVGTSYWMRADGGSSWKDKSSWNSCCGNFTGEQWRDVKSWQNISGESLLDLSKCLKKCGAKHPFNKEKRNNCINECKANYAKVNVSNPTSPIDRVLTTQTPTLSNPSANYDIKSNPPQDDTQANDSESMGDSSEKSISTIAKVGIGVGVVGLLFFGFYLYKKNKSSK